MGTVDGMCVDHSRFDGAGRPGVVYEVISAHGDRIAVGLDVRIA